MSFFDKGRTKPDRSLLVSLAFRASVPYTPADMMMLQTANPTYLARTAIAVVALPSRHCFDTKGRAGAVDVLTGRHAG